MKLSGESANLEFDSGDMLVAANQSRELFFTQEVNLRNCLGDMFDKYDEFLIVFNSLASTATSTATNTYTAGTIVGINQNLVWTLGITGDLRFTNNSVNGQITNTAYLPPRFTLPVSTVSSGNVSFNFPMNNGVSFSKPSNDIVKITFVPYLVRGGAGGSVVAGNADLTIDINLSFSIFGLK